MKKISILVYDVSITGGAERVALNMAKAFSHRYDTEIVSLFYSQGDAADRTREGVALYVISTATRSITANFLSLRGALAAHFKERGTNIVFCITAGVVTLGASAARAAHAACVYCEHSNLENRTYGKKHVLRQYIGSAVADKTVTLTERDMRNFMRVFKTPREKLTVIPNWFTPNETKREYKTDSKAIISAGRLEAVKGHDMLLESAVAVAQRHPDWHWDVFGDGTLREKLENDARERGIDGFVTFRGNVNDLTSRYGDYAMFVLPSYYEGLPMVLLEAACAGLPVVSFDCPTGPAELVANGVNGLIVPERDTAALADAVCTLIENAELRKSMSDKADVKLGEYSAERVLAKWFELIESF